MQHRGQGHLQGQLHFFQASGVVKKKGDFENAEPDSPLPARVENLALPNQNQGLKVFITFLPPIQLPILFCFSAGLVTKSQLTNVYISGVPLLEEKPMNEEREGSPIRIPRRGLKLRVWLNTEDRFIAWKVCVLSSFHPQHTLGT